MCKIIVPRLLPRACRVRENALREQEYSCRSVLVTLAYGLKQSLYESLLAIIGLVKSMFGSC